MKSKIKINLNQLKRIVLIAFLVVLSGAVGFRIGQRRLPVSSEKDDLSLFWHVWQRLESRYLDASALNKEEMIYGAIKGMVASLNDPYTAFFLPQDNQVNKEDLNGEFGGVGIQLGYLNGTLAVISPLDNTPAFKAGIRAGDLILRIVDKEKGVDLETEGISLPEAVKLIRGPKGTKISLTLIRENELPFEVSLARDQIVVPSLVSEWLERDSQKFAHLQLLQFSEVMYEQWEKAVEEILAEKNRADFGGIILDLRNNPGGFLEGSVYVASEFLSSGVVVKQEGLGQDQTYRVNRAGQLLDVPLVVLVNRGSASAAEILAGALRHYNRAKIVGEKTFGKGTVQEPEDLPGGSGLHITVARWLLPGGENIHEQGIEPDYFSEGEEEEDSKQDLILEKGIEILLKGD